MSNTLNRRGAALGVTGVPLRLTYGGDTLEENFKHIRGSLSLIFFFYKCEMCMDALTLIKIIVPLYKNDNVKRR
jgi:hypothetical protein